jgi:hypothetical protein
VIGADAAWRFETAPDAAAEVGPDAPADVVLVFVRAAAELEPAIVEHEQRVFPAGALWIAWPRKAAGHVSDLGDSVVREAALARQLVDVKVAALDHDWSALKLVWRSRHRQ